MPPRKKSKTKKSTPNSEQSDVIVIDRNETVSESENKIEDSAAAEEDCSANEGGSELAEIAGEEINANSMEIEGLPVVAVDVKDEETVVDQRNVMEMKVDEEGVNVEGVMGDHSESLIKQCGAEEDRERIEGKNDNSQMEDENDKGDNKAAEKGVEGEEKEGRDVGNDDTQLGIIFSVADKNSFEEGTAATQISDFEALGNNDNVLILNEGSNEERGDVGDGKDEEDIRDIEEETEVENEDEHPSEFIDNHITDRKKEKDLELFIGNLDKGAVEDDLIKVFGKFGEIRATRVVRNTTTNTSRGFAFIQYATAEQAKNALSSLKGGIQVRGKHVKISASQDNDTVYMGNICKLWTKDCVLETLKSYGIENIEEIHLPDDPQKEGKIKGFALLQFSTHSDALAAFQRLRKPDAVFGRDISAKVAFAQTPMHPTAEILSQVKTVYVEGLTDLWNNEKIREVCKQYGEIVKVKLSRTLSTKRKDFGFITFTSRESALACVDGINNADIGEGEVKVKASIAKPIKGRLQQVARGGFKVKKKSTVPSTKDEGEKENKGQASKMKGRAKSKRVKKKGKIEAEEKGKAVAEPEIGRDIPNKPQTVIESQHIQTSSKLESKNRKRKNRHSKADGREKIGAEHGHNEKPSKKTQGNVRAKQSNKYKKPRRDPHIRKGPNYGSDFSRSRNPYTLGFATSTVSFQGHAYSTVSGSKRPYADMEPHAGYIEPVSQKQGRSYSGHLESPVGMQYKPHAGYLENTVGIQNQPHTRYREPAIGKQRRPHAGYLEPALGTHGQPHAGYIEPVVRGQGPSRVGYFESAVGKHSHSHSHSPYGLVSRRVDGQDLHGSSHSAYGAGSSLQPSYVPNYTGYAGYENRSSVGSRYQSSGSHLPRRSYY